jgi:Domain of unknown function (DUF5134)
MTPAWLLDAVAAVMLGVALISAARLVAAESWRRGAGASDPDVAHLLMAVAMAGMLAPDLHTLPGTAWAVIFGLLAARFAVRVARDARANGVRALAGGHCAPHLVHCCSMVYMFLAVTATAGAGATSGMGGMAGSAGMSLRYPTLALVFAFILVGYSIWDLDQLSGRRYSLRAPRVSLAGMATPGVPAPGLPVLAGAELGSAPLPGPVALRDSAALSGPVAPRGFAAHGPRPGAVGPEGGQQPDAAGGAAAGGHAGGERGFLLSPAVTIGCRIAMGVAMAFMLFIAI